MRVIDALRRVSVLLERVADRLETEAFPCRACGRRPDLGGGLCAGCKGYDDALAFKGEYAPPDPHPTCRRCTYTTGRDEERGT
jgi:predicted Zn-ribbon and HTH transcriptional regulator